MKRNKFTWTFDRHRAEGFTLVELIVVIAILAILGGVAVPAYSGYIKQANMGVDETLISEVRDSVQLHNYATGFAKKAGKGVVGYVVMTEKNGADAATTLTGATEAAYVEDALVAAYGADWANMLDLSYGGWNNAGRMLSIAMNNSYSDAVADSTYFDIVGTESLLNDVQNCTTTFATFLSDKSENTPEELAALIDVLLGTSESVEDPETGEKSGAMAEILAQYGAEASTEALANATVFAMAAKINADADTIISNFHTGEYIVRNYKDARVLGKQYAPLQYDLNSDCLSELAHTYAALEALVAYLGDSEIQGIFNTIDLTGDSGINVLNAVTKACNDIVDKASANGDLWKKLLAYYNYDATGAQGATSPAMTDGKAYVATMQTVDQVRDDFTGDLGSTNLFNNEAVSGTVDSFVAASSLAAYLNQNGHELLTQVCGGANMSAVVLVFTADGNGGLSCAVCR